MSNPAIVERCYVAKTIGEYDSKRRIDDDFGLGMPALAERKSRPMPHMWLGGFESRMHAFHRMTARGAYSVTKSNRACEPQKGFVEEQKGSICEEGGPNIS